MENILKGVIAISFIFAISFEAGSATPTKAPDFSLRNLDGNTVSLQDYRGQVVLLNFWATWCGPCLREMPELERLYQDYRDRGIEVIGIAIVSKQQDIPKKVEFTGVTYPILYGNKQIIADYGNFNSIPQSYLIDQNGTIVKEFTGSYSYQDFEKALKKLLSD